MTHSRRFIVFLALVLLISAFIETAHHHDDEKDHPECPVCVAVHHPPTIGQTAVSGKGPFFCEARLVPASPAFHNSLFLASVSGRAPPA